MRTLSVNHAAFAAESLAVAHTHLKTAELASGGDDHAGAISRLYYAAMHCAKAALADLGRRSKKHDYWVGEFNRRHGRGESWIPRKFTRMLHRLHGLRGDHDYSGAVPNDESLAVRCIRDVRRFIWRVQRNTRLVKYPEFISEFISSNKEIKAIEFDFYCPQAYRHKERLQIQVQASRMSPTYISRIVTVGRRAIRKLGGKKPDHYVLGWNSRFGPSGDDQLVFLDLDSVDYGAIRAALKGKKGWLFKSGKGYHFVFQEMVEGNERWRRTVARLAKSKALRPLIDRRHVAYSTKRGYSTLRVTRSPIKDLQPFLCADLT